LLFPVLQAQPPAFAVLMLKQERIQVVEEEWLPQNPVLD
jgi:hypothetical protein